MRKNSLLIPMCVVFILVPAAARADAGTPLMWAGMLHLVFLNAVIGVIETILVARIFRVPRTRLAIPVIAGNYFSMIAGYALVQFVWDHLEKQITASAPLYYVPRLLFAAIAVSWLLSVLLEWPFCTFGVGPTDRRWQTGFRASVCAQTASYALLIPFYLLVSPITLFRDASITRDLGFAKSQSAMVYYINPADGNVWSVRLNGENRMRVLDANVRDKDGRLSIIRDDRNLCDLTLVERQMQEANHTVLIKDVGSGCSTSDTAGTDRVEGTWFNFGRALDLRTEADREWTAHTGFWAAEGITISHGKVNVYNLAFETPFENWIPRNATILPGDQVVFQLGIGERAQIVLLDMPTRKLALLAMGHGPAVILQPRAAKPAARPFVRPPGERDP